MELSDDEEYVCTKRVRKAGHVLAVILPKDWPFRARDIVDFKIKRMGDSNWIIDQKVVRKTAKSLCIYLNASWGIERDEMVTFIVSLRNEDVRDSRGEVQGECSGSFEV